MKQITMDGLLGQAKAAAATHNALQSGAQLWKMLDEVSASDPEAYKKFMEKNLGDVVVEEEEKRSRQVYRPEPGFVIEAVLEEVGVLASERAVGKEIAPFFVNVCHSKNITEPQMNGKPATESQLDKVDLEIEPGVRREHKGKLITDVVTHPMLVARCRKDLRFKQAVSANVLDMLLPYERQINKSARIRPGSLQFPKLLYKGGKQPQIHTEALSAPMAAAPDPLFSDKPREIVLPSRVGAEVADEPPPQPSKATSVKQKASSLIEVVDSTYFDEPETGSALAKVSKPEEQTVKRPEDGQLGLEKPIQEVVPAPSVAPLMEAQSTRRLPPPTKVPESSAFGSKSLGLLTGSLQSVPKPVSPMPVPVAVPRRPASQPKPSETDTASGSATDPPKWVLDSEFNDDCELRVWLQKDVEFADVQLHAAEHSVRLRWKEESWEFKLPTRVDITKTVAKFRRKNHVLVLQMIPASV